jgi:hypothetical protein
MLTQLLSLSLSLPVLVAAAPGGSVLAQSPTLQRLQEEEAKQHQAEKIEAAKWRSFPKEASATKSQKEKDRSLDAMRGFNPLAPGGLLDPDQNSPDRSACLYKWSDWKLDPATGARATLRNCYGVPESKVPVHCPTVKIRETFLHRDTWLSWRLPKTDGEREMVAALCDNLRLVP